MYLGEEWGAVVLLDEADIYLESRHINEVKRNSLVSSMKPLKTRNKLSTKSWQSFYALSSTTRACSS